MKRIIYQCDFCTDIIRKQEDYLRIGYCVDYIHDVKGISFYVCNRCRLSFEKGVVELTKKISRGEYPHD